MCLADSYVFGLALVSRCGARVRSMSKGRVRARRLHIRRLVAIEVVVAFGWGGVLVVQSLERGAATCRPHMRVRLE